MIAATARIHRLTVATRNERDFASLGAAVLNPFSNTTSRERVPKLWQDCDMNCDVLLASD